MRQFYALQRALQKRPSNGEIARYAVVLCKTLAIQMGSLSIQRRTAIDRSQKTPLQTKQPDIAGILNSTVGAYRLLCQTLQKLPESMSETGMVVYHIVVLYESILNALQEECKATTEQTPSGTTGRAKKPKPAQSAESKKPAPIRLPMIMSTPDSDLAAQFASLLNHMAIALDIACARHQALLEGFLFVLLSRVGELLSNFVFQDIQARPDLFANPAKLPVPAGLLGIGVNDHSQRAARLEAKHVISTLERTVAVMNTSRSPSSARILQSDGDSKILTRGLRKQLQNTLLQAVFGESPKWKNTLQAVSQPDQEGLEKLLNHSPTSEQATPDWFIQEVWRIIGWELLEKRLPRADDSF